MYETYDKRYITVIVLSFIFGAACTGLFFFGYARNTSRRTRELQQQLATAESRIAEQQSEITQRTAEATRYCEVAGDTVAAMGEIFNRDARTISEARATIQALRNCLLEFSDSYTHISSNDNISDTAEGVIND